MAEPLRFFERRPRVSIQDASAATIGTVGGVHPLALTAMEQTGQQVSQKTGRGSQRFLQGGLSAPITVTWRLPPPAILPVSTVSHRRAIAVHAN